MRFKHIFELFFVNGHKPYATAIELTVYIYNFLCQSTLNILSPTQHPRFRGTAFYVLLYSKEGGKIGKPL